MAGLGKGEDINHTAKGCCTGGLSYGGESGLENLGCVFIFQLETQLASHLPSQQSCSGRISLTAHIRRGLSSPMPRLYTWPGILILFCLVKCPSSWMLHPLLSVKGMGGKALDLMFNSLSSPGSVYCFPWMLGPYTSPKSTYLGLWGTFVLPSPRAVLSCFFGGCALRQDGPVLRRPYLPIS